ncbi:MAG: hypothetical protein HW394_346 [Acidobacteria bacterium]|nr:hypothetical protein [Acidobacteriota bacterium]
MKHVLAVMVLLFVFGDPDGYFAQGGAPPGFPPQGRGGGAPPRDAVRDRERPAGTAVIRGRILTADTGTPVRRAQVRAASTDNRDTRLVTTDAQGNFEFRDLPAGRWDVTASKAGFVTMRFGQRRPFEAGRPIEVADAQVMERVNFSLPRGAAITGRVLDEFGDPVANARVQALRYQLVQGTRRLTPIGIMAQSDDTGAFRLYGLMPGDYYVSALLRALPLDAPDETTGYAPTYYPGTGSVTEAQPVPLAVAEEASISFALMPVRTSRVSGTVVNATGGPLANGIVMLTSPDAIGGQQAAFGAGNRIRPDGTFTISNVAPGSYTLTATSGGPGGLGGPGRGGADVDIEMGSLPVSVGGEDLTGITLVTSVGATLTGTVTVGQGTTAKPPAAGLQVTAQPVPPGGGRGLGTRPARVGADGTFTLTNLFGPRLIRVNGLPQEWTLEAVVVAGSDVTDRPVDFGPNEAVENARIVLTDRVTQVSGSVSDRDGKPSRDFTIVVFPEDETKWAAPSRYVRSARPDQQGLVKIRGLPPGDRYLAVAVDYLEEGEANNPEFLDLIKNRATRFRLGPGESTTSDLKLVER